MQTRALALAISALAAATLLDGCTPSGIRESDVVPVKGKVTYKGKALTRGEIHFEPTDIGRDAYGTIAADSSFQMSTFKPNDGAFKGTHTVTVTSPEIPPPKTASQVAAKSMPQARTSVEVTADKTDYTIDVK
jgi:hypothetical protein